MLNMIKMELYRMFRTKSLYVIWIVMTILIIVTTYWSKMDYDLITKEANQEEIVEQTNAAENINLGMNVEIPVEADEPVTVFDMFFANTQAKFMALFLVIFAVMFSTADISSGYIKNIGGQVKNRGFLIASKTFALAVFTILSMAIFVVVQTVAVRIFFGRVMWGEPKDFLTYFGIQVLLHCALLILCMTIAILLRNNVVSMVIAVCLTMNVMSILYSAVDKIVQKAGIEDFQLIQYTLTGKISLLSMTPGVRECMEALGGAAVFGIVLAMLCGFVFEKRDI